jgi:hypothetical protein
MYYYYYSAYGERERRVQGLCGDLREKEHWGNPGVDGRIKFRRIFRKWDMGVWTGLSWLRIGTCGGHL